MLAGNLFAVLLMEQCSPLAGRRKCEALLFCRIYFLVGAQIIFLAHNQTLTLSNRILGEKIIFIMSTWRIPLSRLQTFYATTRLILSESNCIERSITISRVFP